VPEPIGGLLAASAAPLSAPTPTTPTTPSVEPLPEGLRLPGIRLRVESQLAQFLADRASEFEPEDPFGTLIVEPVADLLLRGGKRIRAALCLWAWAGAGGADCEEAVAAATALELLHGCALIHDDVMDASPLRRGGPAVHQELTAVHRARGWRGDPERFGTGAAVAAGDLCLVWADTLLRTSGLPAEALLRAGPAYDWLRTETVRGQCLDLLHQADGALRPADALRTARAKTAAGTTLGPLRLGAELAGAPEELTAAYAAYGLPLGIAFQLRDDLLGAFGDPAETGKPAGDDLRDGTCTMLLAEARQRVGPRGAAELESLLRDGDGSPSSLRELRALLERCGARAQVEHLAAEFGTAARQAIDRAPLVDARMREPLRELVTEVCGA
jgi:geranylgeranyl diphosphate synthase type I